MMDRFHPCIQRVSRGLCGGCLSVLLVVFVVSSSGCTEKQKGGPRLDVTPLKGKVLVDGKPEENIGVLFLRVSGTAKGSGVDFSVPEPEGITDIDGNITVNTYRTGDGGTPGEYKLCFVWLEEGRGLSAGELRGDKFRGKYDGKDRSQFTVKIPGVTSDDEPYDMGTFELTTD